MTNQWHVVLEVYLKDGQQTNFEDYERKVLPLLANYGGSLVSAIRPSSKIAGTPDELHVITFPSKEAFEAYKQNPKRAEFSPIFQQAVEKVRLIEGEDISNSYA